jgi:hypothetical protein
MTKQEQIEEMRREIGNGFRKADCRKPYTNEPYPYFETQITTIAEALYEAGYRKIKGKNETLEEQIKHLNTIVERLDELLGKGINDYIMGIDGVEGIKDMWERSAVRAFAEKVKTKSYVNDYCREVVEIDKIDELLKEYKE